MPMCRVTIRSPAACTMGGCLEINMKPYKKCDISPSDTSVFFQPGMSISIYFVLHVPVIVYSLSLNDVKVIALFWGNGSRDLPLSENLPKCS